VCGKAAREILGFVGVAGSMLFVGLELRQNNQLARASAYQELGVTAAGICRDILYEEETAELLVAARDSGMWDQFTEVEWLRLSGAVVSGLRLRETIELQIEEGVLPDGAGRRLGFDVNYWPYLAEIWPDIRGSFSEDFARKIEAEYGLTP
jgi:hypothetical protein